MTQYIRWDEGAVALVIRVEPDGKTFLESLRPSGCPEPKISSKHFDNASLPLVAARLAGYGNAKDKSSKCLIGSYLSEQLVYKKHATTPVAEGQGSRLDVTLAHESSGIEFTVHYQTFGMIPVVRSSVTARNISTEDVVLTQLSSFSLGGLTTDTASNSWWTDYTLMTANNSWFREAQWHEQSLVSLGLSDVGVLDTGDGHKGSLASHSISNRGTFSTGTHLPMGLLKRCDLQESFVWQVEHNGSWRWEIGDWKDSLYLTAGGPTQTDHDWEIRLSPGSSFESVPVAFSKVSGPPDEAFGIMNDYRRAMRRKHKDNEALPIIFNDYMNCLMGDPTEDKIKALLQPVVDSGAEYFVIDAGWYADDSGWWDDVGLWEPSKKRFPSGFKELLKHIRDCGLRPGVWLEPEVIGVRSVVGQQLPEECFFQQRGSRIVERGRFQLDFTHPLVCQRLDRIVDRLVLEYGVCYFKFDYNIEVTFGNDRLQSAGAGQLNHNRSYLQWINRLFDRYPELVIENCSSGAQRMDYAMLKTHPIQSTSDQQDPFLYAAIVAALPTAVAPEQSATWAYPQREWDDETNAFTLVNCLLGRIHLSGRLDHMSTEQLALVNSAMSVYKDIRGELASSRPIWPLGLPTWTDDWISLALATPSRGILLAVWRRGGSHKCSLPFPQSNTPRAHVELLFPKAFEVHTAWSGNSLEITLQSRCARLFRLT